MPLAYLRLITNGLQRGGGRHPHGGRLGERRAVGHVGNRAPLAHHHMRGKGPGACAKHAIANLELRDPRPHGLDRAGEVGADALFLGCAKARLHAHDVGLAAQVVPVERIHRRGAHAHQHLRVGGGGGGKGLETQHLGAAVAVVAVHPCAGGIARGGALCGGIGAGRLMAEGQRPARTGGAQQQHHYSNPLGFASHDWLPAERPRVPRPMVIRLS